MSPRALQDELISSGRQPCRGRACRQVRGVGGRSGSIVMCCVNQSSTSARCQPMDFPQWVRCFGKRPTTARPNSSQRGRRARREISRPLRIARTSGSGSLTHRGRRTSCVVARMLTATGLLSVDDRVSMPLPHQDDLMGQRVRSPRVKCSARIQGIHGSNTTRICGARRSR